MHICYFIGIEAQQRERGYRKDGANGGGRRLQNRQDTSLLLRHVISLRGSQLTPRYLVGTYTFLLLRLATRSLGLSNTANTAKNARQSCSLATDR